MIQVGLGHAEGFDTETIVKQVLLDCRDQLQEKPPGGGIVFAGPHIDHALMIAMIHEAFPGVELVGCTTAGNFSSFSGAGDDAVTLTLLSSDQIEFGAGVGPSLSTDYQHAVQQALSSARGSLQDDPSLCLVFPHSYGIPFEPILDLLNSRLGEDCPIFGGVAGTLWNDPATIMQFCGKEILTDSLPLLLMSGPVEHRFSIANSWRPVGSRATIGRSDDRRVYKIGTSSAVDFYCHYLGHHEEPAREFTLAVYEPGGDTYYICAPVEYHDDGSITFTGPIAEGAEIQLTEAAKADLVQDTIATSKALNSELLSWQPAMAMSFSCGFRKTILGTDVEKELDALRESHPENLPITGFFSFGEIAPLTPGGPSKIQGATLITLQIGPGAETDGRPAVNKIVQRSGPAVDAPKSYEFIERKLKRSEANRQRLESLKDFTTQMHHQMMAELEDARREIEEKEGRLRESEEKFRRIVRTAGEGFILVDSSSTIIDTNDAYCSLTGFQRDDVVGKQIKEFFLAEDTQQLESAYRQLLEENYQRFEATLIASDGRLIPTLVHSNVLQDDSGRLIGYMAFFADLTEQKKALALAGEVQKSLLPQGNPQVSGLDIAGRNVSCDEVGGDYYDFFLQQDLPAHAFSVAVGDITGHGVDAALLMSSARAFLRMHAVRDDSIVAIVENMNRHLAEDVLETGRFMTLFYLCIHSDLTSLEWVRAGHDPAILYDPDSDTCEDLRGPGVALGFDPEFDYQSVTRDGLKNGNIIAIGTDGIWETVNQSGEMFGRERFKEVLRGHAHLPASDLLNTVFTEVESFRGGRKSEDDLTLVIVKILNP